MKSLTFRKREPQRPMQKQSTIPEHDVATKTTVTTNEAGLKTMRKGLTHLRIPGGNYPPVSSGDKHGVLRKLLAAQKVREVMPALRGHLRVVCGR